jgi:cytidyltransferase-like protein
VAVRVLYPGGFDLLHKGHTAALTTARSIATRLTVAVNSDAFMTYYKRTPQRPAAQRISDVLELGVADEVIEWDGPEGQDQQILHSGCELYLAGTDWLTKDLAHQLGLPTLGWFDDHNISLLYLRRTPGISTTGLINAVG